ncbi:MAG: class I SAM-dependent methyltransferase [Hyphomicrobiales bacterium]|nr:class I SAM-dependent methyltransferase [Hyphomicrobiales bacterium]
MSHFSSDWLALREPYDAAARNPNVLAAVLAAFHGQESIAVVDMACGTGATLRAIGARLPSRQRWLMVDNDLGLLGVAAGLARPPDTIVTARPVDLVRDLELALDGPLDLITASALLDLVSEEWLERLLVEAATRRLPLYAALSYDGRVVLDPADALDGAIIGAINRHQCSDKGFGPALGPDAGRAAARMARRIGYSVVEGHSDWQLDAHDTAIQTHVLRGFAQAAGERDGLDERRIAGWLERRMERLAAGASRMRIGHVDLVALPIPIL